METGNVYCSQTGHLAVTANWEPRQKNVYTKNVDSKI